MDTSLVIGISLIVTAYLSICYFILKSTKIIDKINKKGPMASKELEKELYQKTN